MTDADTVAASLQVLSLNGSLCSEHLMNYLITNMTSETKHAHFASSDCRNYTLMFQDIYCHTEIHPV